MRTMKRLAVLLAVGALGGCSMVSGTWVSPGGADKSKNPIARATFCHDGTFTAEADYGDRMKGMSGHYSYDWMNGKLALDADGQKREYDCTVSGDEMTIGKSGAKMTRMK